MTQLYITDSSAKVGYRENQITIQNEEHGISTHPVENVDSVAVFGMPYLSTSFLRKMLERKIDLQFFNQDGHYIGRLISPESTSPEKQRLQVNKTGDDKFRLAITKQIVTSKIRNQMCLVRAYCGEIDVTAELEQMQYSIEMLYFADAVNVSVGYEGNAAKAYFSALAKLVPKNFEFQGRSTRPPKDAFNSMISFGYSILYKHITGVVERCGLNPYFGFMHEDREGHMSLVSDLIEQWRAIIVDDTVMQVILHDEVTPDLFEPGANGGVYISREALRTISQALGEKIIKAKHYLRYEDFSCGFQYACERQVLRLVKAMQSDDPSLYMPVESGFDE
jgi:CRISPR-associated protein Cas1